MQLDYFHGPFYFGNWNRNWKKHEINCCSWFFSISSFIWFARWRHGLPFKKQGRYMGICWLDLSMLFSLCIWYIRALMSIFPILIWELLQNVQITSFGTLPFLSHLVTNWFERKLNHVSYYLMFYHLPKNKTKVYNNNIIFQVIILKAAVALKYQTDITLRFWRE